jgi:putative transposase
MGLILAVEIQPANVQDRDGAKAVLAHAHWFGNLKVVWADAGYAGALETWVAEQNIGRSARLEIIRKLAGKGFQLLPKRWVVERTFAWLSRHRRLARDYEVKLSHSKAFTYIAATRYMASRLARIKAA